MLQKIFAAIFLILLSPVIVALCMIHKLKSGGKFFFTQIRLGQNKKPFTIYKIRTMVENSDDIKTSLVKQNEADGPVFKIRNDPRFEPLGKFLSHSGLDEIPQLWNIVKGDMAFIGPRPLPQDEAVKIPRKYQKRFSVLPGITSSWVVDGSHKMTFEEWMNKDLEYIENKTLSTDLKIVLKTVFVMLRSQ